MRTFNYQGSNFSFDVQGQGEPVIFIQGVGLHGAGWKPQTDELSKSFQCVTFDNRGMGQSQPVGNRLTIDQMARDTCALMDANEISSAHLVGHSLGGVIAQQVALTYPGRVRSLALLCTSARGADATRLTAKMIWVGLRTRVGTRRMRRLAFLQLVLSPEALASSDLDRTAKDLEPLFGHDLADTPSIVMPQLRALKEFDASGKLQELAAFPTLILSAEHDAIFPMRCGRDLANEIPGSRLIEMPKAAHGVTIERAAEVNQFLTEHLAQANAKWAN